METISHTLESTLASIDTIENAACDCAARAGFESDDLDRIGLAVREVSTNAIVHGNRYDRRKKMFVTISRTASRLEITISDQGAGFDWASVADPISPDALLRTSGRGLFLARAFTDESHVRRGAFAAPPWCWSSM
jgi:serine/threonine-protein kinase RsbW